MTRLAAEYNAVNLGQGFPDFPGPDFVKDAAKTAIDADLNQYAISAGSARLRAEIAKRYSLLFDREIDPRSEVTVTSGATEALFAAMTAFVGPGQRVVAFEPFYDSYRPSVSWPLADSNRSDCLRLIGLSTVRRLNGRLRRIPACSC